MHIGVCVCVCVRALILLTAAEVTSNASACLRLKHCAPPSHRHSPPSALNPASSPGTGSYKTVNLIKLHLFSLYRSVDHVVVIAPPPPPPHTPFRFLLNNSICFVCAVVAVVLSEKHKKRPLVLSTFFFFSFLVF